MTSAGGSSGVVVALFAVLFSLFIYILSKRTHNTQQQEITFIQIEISSFKLLLVLTLFLLDNF